jgi:hypothetical protein
MSNFLKNKINMDRVKLDDLETIGFKIMKKELIDLPFRFEDDNSTHIMIFMLKKSFSSFVIGSYFTDAFGNMGKTTQIFDTKANTLKKAQKKYYAFKDSNMKMIESMILDNEGESGLEKYKQGLS